jgi:inorganic pyrophosphatase
MKEIRMPLENIPVGKNPPHDVNVIIENSMGGLPVKYEMDKDSGFMFVDRFLHTAMAYPGNYGFIPHTLSGDGDPVDVLVVTQLPIMPGAVVRARPIGVLLMEDDGGQDEKIIAVPVSKIHPYYDSIQDIEDLQPIIREQIAHFFTHYKDLEKGKWSKIKGWGNVKEAEKLIIEGINQAKK